jgi:hypothetical protein
MANEKTSARQAQLQRAMSRLTGTLRDLAGKAAAPGKTRATPRELFDDAVSAVREAAQEVQAVQQEARVVRRAQLQARTEALLQPLAVRKEGLQQRRERRKEEVTAGVEDAFVVAGRVLDADTGDGLAGVHILVRERDRDPDQDDVLGETWTDEQGFYRKVYHPADFNAVFDKQPETYIHVLDAEGNVLFTSDRSFRHKAGAVEVINAAVDGSKVPGSQARSRTADRIAEAEIETIDQHQAVLNSRLAARLPAVPAEQPKSGRTADSSSKSKKTKAAATPKATKAAAKKQASTKQASTQKRAAKKQGGSKGKPR